MNNSEHNFLPISACCPHHAGIGRRKFNSATAVAEAALAFPLASEQDLSKVAQTQS
jgi:hypothetical protein